MCVCKTQQFKVQTCSWQFCFKMLSKALWARIRITGFDCVNGTNSFYEFPTLHILLGPLLFSWHTHKPIFQQTALLSLGPNSCLTESCLYNYPFSLKDRTSEHRFCVREEETRVCVWVNGKKGLDRRVKYMVSDWQPAERQTKVNAILCH